MGRRLTLTVPSLGYGGAERVLARLANSWAARGDTVTVITLSNAAGDTYPLDPEVTRVALDLMRESGGPFDAIRQNLKRKRALRRAVERSAPDTIVSFTDRMNVLTLLACRGLSVDTVIAERIDPSQHEIGRPWSILRRLLYPSARALVVQTDRVRRKVASLMKGKPVYVVPNAVDAPRASKPPDGSPKSADAHWILGIGRLVPQKGFDLLIEAFSRIAARHPQWSLKILGEGAERRNLERLISDKGLAGRVLLPGWQSDTSTPLWEAELFVLSSRYEGFPNALLEAMAHGVASVSFDCDCGPAEILRSQTDGILVPAEDVAGLAAAIDRLIGDDPLRRRLAAEAVRVVERFSPERHFARWEAVLRRDPPEAVDRIE